ncbi:MAG: efflux RND transporter periplasmic adaptor subunit [Oscillospiraceae bacterium]|nr:efflux RND transporter periplasmic adaptor subunit [Oscillospiraceae bacterium]
MKLKLPALSKKKWISLIAAVVALILIFTLALGSCSKRGAQNAAVEYEPYTVTRGDIVVSVTGSGTVEPIEQYEIQSIVTGDIIEDHLNVGDSVTEDQILYVIDSESARNSIERSETSYEQQLISYNNKLNDYNEAEANRSVRAPIGGVITQMYVKDGDEINAGTKLFEIRNTESLTVSVPFLSANAKNIKPNQTATIFFDDRNESHTGYVSHVATGTYATEAGAIVSDVEITFKNPGAILPGETVTATVGGYACNDIGTVQEADNETITAKVSGDVRLLDYNKGDKVTNENVILNIVDDSAASDMRSNELSLKNSRLSLDDQIEKLNDYTIRSPIAGTVISKTMKAGDTLDGNKSSLAIVADMSKLTFEISVDELYIQNIKVGQTVSVTADALEGQTFEGVVDTVSIIGTPSNGVTVYPVSIVISEYEGLLPGMNVDAEIVISDASDVLMVPVNAVSRGNLVLVKENSDIQEKQTKDNKKGARTPEAPDGYKYVMVETGEANDDFVEIKSVLNEGDVIYVAAVKNTQSAQSPFGMSGGMPAGGMRGSMPSGGMPGGMNSSRGGMSGTRSGGMR